MIELTIALVIFLFPLAYSPGPGNLFFAANGARFGVRGILQAMIGYHIATWVVTLLIGIGFGEVARAWPNFFTVIQYLGSAYVFYLAWKLVRAGVVDDGVQPAPANFMDGVILLMLNPKAYLIISVMFAQFLDNSDASRWFVITWITSVFTLNNLIAFYAWAYVGDKLLYRFRNAQHAKKLNVSFGTILAAVAVWMLFN